jgi:cytidylate kinase
MHPVITIDGPSGAGKGTIAYFVAKRLNWNLLDSGLIYRALVFQAIDKNIPLHDHKKLVDLATNLELEFTLDEATSGFTVVYQGKAINKLLRSEEIGLQTAKIATIEQIRIALIQCQRNFAVAPGLVADGRDMGTCIFPNATIKFFITASIEERAKRRQKQLYETNINANIDELLLQIKKRDEKDSQRTSSPLKQAKDAISIDTTNLSIEQVLSVVFKHLSIKGLL